MTVTCPACGGQSKDVEFCDHCNADLRGRSETAVPSRCPLVPEILLSPEQQAALTHPEGTIVIGAGPSRWRVHWIGEADWPSWRPAVEHRLGQNVPVLPPCQVVEDRGGVWLAAAATGRPFTPWRGLHPTQTLANAQRLAEILARLARALEELHAAGLVWLTFDPREIEESGDGSGESQLQFTNLDLEVHRQGQCPDRLRMAPHFAAPEAAQFHVADIGPRTNVYHLALFAYYWLARLLPSGFPGRGLEAFQFQVPPLRTYVPTLPPGLARVVNQGLAIEPGQRFSQPLALCQALDEALARALNRYASTAPVRWEIGFHTRTGRTKTALQGGNEDFALVRTFAQPDRALAAVADGITTCQVGSGALASWMTGLVLENTFDADSTLISFPKQIRAACRKAGAMLLDWALEKGYRDQLAAGLDLMGTTLTAGWLEGRHLGVANVGDSRAYLITDDFVEQLTVDGDLGSDLLASGTPPEEVRDMGTVTRALRVCVGGCTRNEAGALSVLDEVCQPALSFWPLVPGDVVILCSDGLVEEGAFLEPERLGELVRQQRALSPEALAILLSDEADALHRLPSDLEPEGFGDNITCVVIKIAKG